MQYQKCTNLSVLYTSLTLEFLKNFVNILDGRCVSLFYKVVYNLAPYQKM